MHFTDFVHYIKCILSCITTHHWHDCLFKMQCKFRLEEGKSTTGQYVLQVILNLKFQTLKLPDEPKAAAIQTKYLDGYIHICFTAKHSSEMTNSYRQVFRILLKLLLDEESNMFRLEENKTHPLMAS